MYLVFTAQFKPLTLVSNGLVIVLLWSAVMCNKELIPSINVQGDFSFHQRNAWNAPDLFKNIHINVLLVWELYSPIFPHVVSKGTQRRTHWHQLIFIWDYSGVGIFSPGKEETLGTLHQLEGGRKGSFCFFPPPYFYLIYPLHDFLFHISFLPPPHRTHENYTRILFSRFRMGRGDWKKKEKNTRHHCICRWPIGYKGITRFYLIVDFTWYFVEFLTIGR